MTEPELIHTETWYELETAFKGTEDWFAAPEHNSDTPEGIKKKLKTCKPAATKFGYDLRMVKKTLTISVISQ